MIKEEKFNKYFSLFILIGMISVVLGVNLVKMLSPEESNKAMLALVTFGAIMGVFTSVMSANGMIWNFFFGVINVSICAYTNFDSGNMGQFLLHALYFLPMQFVGIWQWRKRGAGGKGGSPAPKARLMGWKLWLIVVLSVIAATAVVYTLLYYIDLKRLGDAAELDRTKILLDAVVMVLNIAGQILLALCFSDSWYIWNLVNLFSIVLWLNRASAPDSGGYEVVMVVKYSFYLLNSLNGLRIWLKLARKDSSATV